MVHTDGLSGELGALTPDHRIPEVVLEVPVDQLAHVTDGVPALDDQRDVEIGLLSLGLEEDPDHVDGVVEP